LHSRHVGGDQRIAKDTSARQNANIEIRGNANGLHGLAITLIPTTLPITPFDIILETEPENWPW
jgi:hypothetical protein